MVSDYIKSCKSVKIVLLINFSELIAKKAQVFLENTIATLNSFIIDPLQNLPKFRFLYSRVPSDMESTSIELKLVQLQDVLKQNEDHYQAKIL